MTTIKAKDKKVCLKAFNKTMERLSKHKNKDISLYALFSNGFNSGRNYQKKLNLKWETYIPKKREKNEEFIKRIMEFDKMIRSFIKESKEEELNAIKKENYRLSEREQGERLAYNTILNSKIYKDLIEEYEK